MHDRHIKITDEVANRLRKILATETLRPEARQVYEELIAAREGPGRVTVFGNQGWLYRNAMTWFDHGTHSVWTQVWGQALMGPLRGTVLERIPASIEPWRTWKARHPDTLVLDERRPMSLFYQERARDNFEIGIEVAGQARAFHFAAVKRAGVVNDAVGAHPVVLYVDAESRAIGAFFRRLGTRTLTFSVRDGLLVDEGTGSAWNPTNGLAVRGPLAGESLKPVPYIPAFTEAWRDFYPKTSWFPATR